MRMETPKMVDLKAVFYKNNGLPKKEFLITAPEIVKTAGYKTPKNIYEYKYFMHVTYSVLNAIMKQAREHNILMIAVKLGKYVHYGFTQDKDKIESSLKRIESRKMRLLQSTKEIKKLTAQVVQLELAV